MKSHSSLIKEILNRELSMFVSVPSRFPASCQADPEGFRLHRSSQFSVWTKKALRSYLKDLKKAEKLGKNLMTLKYARMENQIPPLHNDPEVEKRIDRMISIQQKWQQELAVKYPGIIGRGRPLAEQKNTQQTTSFSTYLRGELETYSVKTLALLHKDLIKAESGRKNLAEGIYLALAKNLGYKTLQDAETRIKENKA